MSIRDLDVSKSPCAYVFIYVYLWLLEFHRGINVESLPEIPQNRLAIPRHKLNSLRKKKRSLQRFCLVGFSVLPRLLRLIIISKASRAVT